MNVTVLAALGLNGALALGALLKGSVSPSGAVAGFLLGVVIYLSGSFPFWLILVAFFISSSLLSRWGGERKRAAGKGHQRGSRRDWIQVCANGGVGALFALLFLLTGQRVFAACFAAAFAAANADTWAGEIGMLSRKPPVSVLDGRTLPRGTSGGVTLQGYLGAGLGALLIALIYLLQGFSAGLADPRLFGEGGMILLTGFFGAWIDSILGATLQAKYRCALAGDETERPYSLTEEGGSGPKNALIRGLPFMTNDAVNFFSGLASTALAAVVMGLLF